MITQERLKELLHYEPSTGIFTWRVDSMVALQTNRTTWGVCVSWLK